MHISLITNLDTITEETLQPHLQALPLWRRQQALRYKHLAGQRESAMAYRLLQQNLQQEYAISQPPHFILTEHGKPMLQEHPTIHFNLSHCRKAVICVTHHAPVGVDIECERRITPSLMRYTMNDDEVALIEQSTNPTLQFLRLWTQKEAVFKLTGTGITTDVRQILVTADMQRIHIQTVEDAACMIVYSIATYNDTPAQPSLS